MSASPQISPNRRRRVRHKVRTPAYASFGGQSQSAMLDLNEVLNISEDGVAIQCGVPLQAGRDIDLCLDLAEASGQINTVGRVVWSDASGRSGLRFSDLSPTSLFRLREWLFLNAMSGVSYNQPTAANVWHSALTEAPPSPSYTDTLAALSAVQREVESLGSDFESVLQLAATRAQSLSQASGAAIALSSDDPDVMTCRGNAGSGAPPVGASLHVESGFSGECVRTAKILRCDDTETDSRVNTELCRTLGVRSLLAAPLCSGSKVIGLLEVFSSNANAFSETHNTILQRIAEMIVGAIHPTHQLEHASVASVDEASPVNVSSSPAGANDQADSTGKAHSGIRLPRSHLVILICAAATVFLSLGFLLAPWIQERIHSHGQLKEQTVLASSRPSGASTTSGIGQASLRELEREAENGNAGAQNALGVHYVTGDGVTRDEVEAARWFTKAAEQGNSSAQFRLGSFYLTGRGVPQSTSQAYFWFILARAAGDENGKALAPVAASHLTRGQTRAIEEQADLWLHQHQFTTSASSQH